MRLISLLELIIVFLIALVIFGPAGLVGLQAVDSREGHAAGRQIEVLGWPHVDARRAIRLPRRARGLAPRKA